MKVRTVIIGLLNSPSGHNLSIIPVHGTFAELLLDNLSYQIKGVENYNCEIIKKA